MNNLKTKVNDLDIHKLKDIPVDLKKVSDVVSTELVKNLKLKKINTRVNNLEKKVPNGTALIHTNQYNAYKQNLETKEGKKVPIVTTLVTPVVVLNAIIGKIENKVPGFNNLVTTKVAEFENEIADVSGSLKEKIRTLKHQELSV